VELYRGRIAKLDTLRQINPESLRVTWAGVLTKEDQ
jgi:hypothetical protein